MRGTTRGIASAVIVVLGLLCSAGARAQSVAVQPVAVQPVSRMASVAPGSIQGTVQDEKGAPISGAVVSAYGASTAFAVSDRGGRFVLRTLSPGPYLVRAHLSGFAASRGQIVDVHPSGRASSLLAMHRVEGGRVLEAGMSDIGAPPPVVDYAPAADSGSQPIDDHGETAWRLRHARRGILKDAVVPESVLADGGEPDAKPFGLSGAFDAPARQTTSFFGGAPISGQFNLLTTSSFDTPQQLFTTDTIARGVAYMSVGAPVGSSDADWNVRGAITQGDISSWILAGSYVTRAPARHVYDVGLSYSTQRYNGGNPAAVHDVGDTSRDAGTVYGFDTFTLTPALAMTYGARYARYDYLEGRSLVSPRVGLTLSATPHLRISGLLSRRAVAPGAEEFLPPSDGGIFLPPQRTFSSLSSDQPLQAERTTHAQIEMDRDIRGGATLVLRGFAQHVDNQLVTAFGISMPGGPSTAPGHYFVGNDGAVNATGWTAGLRAAVAHRVHASVEYTETHAEWTPTSDLSYLILLAPAASRLESDHIHDIATTIETDLPETSTKVLVVYRVSNAFARPVSSPPDQSMFDSRFDVQVRQSLPFMDFSSTRWEMLIAVRNFFRETAPDQSVYDELLVVRPPKRIIGGLTLHF